MARPTFFLARPVVGHRQLYVRLAGRQLQLARVPVRLAVGAAHRRPRGKLWQAAGEVANALWPVRRSQDRARSTGGHAGQLLAQTFRQ